MRIKRKFIKKVSDWFLAIAIVFLLARLIATTDWLDDHLHGIARVSDGDSLTLNGERIRLWGIDAPELDQLCRRDGKTYSCGRAAKNKLQTLIGMGQVSCQIRHRDKYNRQLAICEAGGVVLNEAMVESGWAVAYGGYATQELLARTYSRGLWQGTFDMPRAWRDGGRDALADDVEPNWFARSATFVQELAATTFLWFRSLLGGVSQ